MNDHLNTVDDCLNYASDVISAIYRLLVQDDGSNDMAATLAQVASDYVDRARDALAAAQTGKA